MKKILVVLLSLTLVGGYLRLLVSNPEANPFELIHFWRNHAYVINYIRFAEISLREYKATHGILPPAFETAVRWRAETIGVPEDRVLGSGRGELFYWTNGEQFVLVWQDPRVRTSHAAVAYSSAGYVGDPISLARYLAEKCPPKAAK